MNLLNWNGGGRFIFNRMRVCLIFENFFDADKHYHLDVINSSESQPIITFLRENVKLKKRRWENQRKIRRLKDIPILSLFVHSYSFIVRLYSSINYKARGVCQHRNWRYTTKEKRHTPKVRIIIKIALKFNDNENDGTLTTN